MTNILYFMESKLVFIIISQKTSISYLPSKEDGNLGSNHQISLTRYFQSELILIRIKVFCHLSQEFAKQTRASFIFHHKSSRNEHEKSMFHIQFSIIFTQILPHNFKLTLILN